MDTAEDAANIKEKSCIEAEMKPEIVRLNHQELLKLTKATIDNLVEGDSLLSGLPSDVTIEELKSQVAVVQGQAITLFLNRGQLPKLAVVVIHLYNLFCSTRRTCIYRSYNIFFVLFQVPPHNTTVLDLKKAVKRHMNLSLKRENVNKKISWKHVWKKYHLCFKDIRLSNDKENIKAYGIANKVELHFAKRRREKNKLIKS